MSSLAGRILYHSVHRPIAAVNSFFADGGPWQQRRTALGRQAMEDAVQRLPALTKPADGRPLELHLLTGERFWYQTAFCLHTFAAHAGRTLAPVIYDDGTLGRRHRDPLARLFPEIRFVSAQETLAKLDVLLPEARFPALRDRWRHYPNIRKLTDPHLGSAGWKLVLDSDLLFFRSPGLLVDWLEDPRAPLHAVDCITSYGYSRPLLDGLAGAPLAELVNVGLCGLRSESLDWERLEHWCRTLIDRERTNYFLEQALVAMLVAGRECVIASATDYVTRPRPPEAHACTAVMHHYVADSKRWYFQDNWRRSVTVA